MCIFQSTYILHCTVHFSSYKYILQCLITSLFAFSSLLCNRQYKQILVLTITLCISCYVNNNIINVPLQNRFQLLQNNFDIRDECKDVSLLYFVCYRHLLIGQRPNICWEMSMQQLCENGQYLFTQLVKCKHAHQKNLSHHQPEQWETIYFLR